MGDAQYYDAVHEFRWPEGGNARLATPGVSSDCGKRFIAKELDSNRSDVQQMADQLCKPHCATLGLRPWGPT